MNSHKITANHEKNLAFSAKIDQYTLSMDTTDEQSSGFGPSPKKLMLASLAGCTGIDVVSILEKMKVNFSDFSIEIKAKLTDEHPKIYQNVAIVYTIKVDETNKPKVERAVQLSKEKYCGVSAMFGHFAQISWKIDFL